MVLQGPQFGDADDFGNFDDGGGANNQLQLRKPRSDRQKGREGRIIGHWSLPAVQCDTLLL